MACAIGVSRQMLLKIDNYVYRFGKLDFIEAFFNTLAMTYKLSILNPPALKSIVFEKSWTCEKVFNHSMNWFHPIKNQTKFINHCKNKGIWEHLPRHQVQYISDDIPDVEYQVAFKKS